MVLTLGKQNGQYQLREAAEPALDAGSHDGSAIRNLMTTGGSGPISVPPIDIGPQQCRLLRVPAIATQCVRLAEEVRAKQNQLGYWKAPLAAELEERERNTEHPPQLQLVLC